VPFRPSPDFLLISEAAAATFAVARLFQFRLCKRFPVLIAYLLVTAFRAASLSILAGTSKPYLWVYLVTSPAICVVAALSVREMFALVFRDYPGLRTAGRWALYLALTLAIGISFLGVHAPWPNETPNTRLLFYELLLEHAAVFSLAVVIAFLMVFLSRFPLDLDRNTRVASGFFSAVFVAQAVVRLVDTLSPRLFAFYADYPEVCFTACCFIGWGIMLQPASAPAPVRGPANKQKETELLQQLESLNDILSRSMRR
jgi:hypothetical protein